MVRRVSELLTGSLIVFAFAVSAIAQGGRAEINGTVIDAGNAVVPGATITVTEENTGLQRTTISSSDGRYVVPTLLPGTYTIKAELQGFRTATQTGLVLLVGQELTVQLTLQIGGLAEEVTVTGESPIVEVTSSRIGTNITNNEIDALPAAGRNQLSLMQLVPGLTPSLVPGSFEGGQYNANGQATTANVFLVDGAYDNDDRRGGSQGTQARVTLDTMAEYEVLTHHYSAEYGGSSGAIVNTVTRSGSNRLRGRAFYYLQNDDLNATNYFLKQAGKQNPESSSNVFGGSGRTIRQEQGVLVRQRGAQPSAAGREPQLPGKRSASGRLVLGHDRLHRVEHVRSGRLPVDRQQPPELPVGARSRAHRERRAGGQQQHARQCHLRERQRRPGLQLRRDVSVGEPGDQRVQGGPRP